MTHSRSASGFSYLCSTSPGLNEVWISHLVPLILHSKVEMQRKKCLVMFTLDHSFQYVGKYKPSDLIWHVPCRAWYVQPDVLFWSPSASDLRINLGNKVVVSHVSNNSICCRMRLQYDRHDHMITRDLFACSDLVHLAVWNNGKMWLTDYRDPHLPGFHELLLQIDRGQILGACAHSQHQLVMNAVRHKVHTLKHPTCVK
jgi:hypothetical protein